jgi:hypothetical protein
VWVCFEWFAPPFIQDFSINIDFCLDENDFLYDNAQICVPCTEHHAEKRHGRDHEISPPNIFSFHELAIFIGKKGTHYFALGGSVAYVGLGFKVYLKP